MPLTLHEAFVPSAKQILGGMRGLVDKAEVHCAENGIEASELYEAKLAETMWTLPWHVRACWVHSGFALGLYKTGAFSPDFTELPADWDAMRAMIDDALAQLDAITVDELEALADKTIGFELGGKRLMELTGQNFLLSFNQPNLYFHATTFYDILRMKGVALGKRDYMGAPRIIGA
ncbi:DUF1993 domain-containing protein [uncultured Erythrobacter sp.]|uniref:DUF1993 domain-containing protein n=1 Tax=uncultured Erythrobacter sp. TaxID=263913 RepID=UPI0026337745|nr:DUF1993 domain-containing protein [uncultured Erythrobacter sp.]